MALDIERIQALRGAKLYALVDGALRKVSGAGLDSDVSAEGGYLFDGFRLWTLASAETPEAALGSGLFRAGLHGDSTPLTVCFDDPVEAAEAARRATALEPSPEVCHVDGDSLVVAAPREDLPYSKDEYPVEFAREFHDLCRSGGVDPVLEHGTWLGEVLGLEVVRAVAQSRLGGRPVIEVGIGRFDREAGVLMRGSKSDAEALVEAADLVRVQRHSGAGAHPLATLARERWMRWDVCAHPESLGLIELVPIDPADKRLNLRDPSPAPAIGTGPDGGRVLVVCSVGVDPRLISAAAELVLRETPDRVVVVLPVRDVMAPVERVVARLRIPALVVGLRGSWAA
ncbi:MAG: hypothetical protein P8M16_01680 [Acidimicrobiales bacterium]|nr:hypothetical protein [Acidimicrobiales bacterium]